MAASGYRIGTKGSSSNRGRVVRTGKDNAKRGVGGVANPTGADGCRDATGKAVRQRGAESKARVYADVNEKMPKDYWDYEALEVQWGCVAKPFF